MQRMVGSTLAIGARLILDGTLGAGLRTPLDVPYDPVFGALAQRGIRPVRREASWDGSRP
jgi:NAD(P)H-hydrate repair Nnr-like enzyme with NAD(P)H-hydrate epimerase domain